MGNQVVGWSGEGMEHTSGIHGKAGKRRGNPEKDEKTGKSGKAGRVSVENVFPPNRRVGARVSPVDARKTLKHAVLFGGDVIGTRIRFSSADRAFEAAKEAEQNLWGGGGARGRAVQRNCRTTRDGAPRFSLIAKLLV